MTSSYKGEEVDTDGDQWLVRHRHGAHGRREGQEELEESSHDGSDGRL